MRAVLRLYRVVFGPLSLSLTVLTNGSLSHLSLSNLSLSLILLTGISQPPTPPPPPPPLPFPFVNIGETGRWDEPIEMGR